MRFIIVAVYLLYVFSATTLAAEPPATNTGDFAIAEFVTFIGAERVASQLIKTVFAVQIPGNKSGEWSPLGSGFIVVGGKELLLGITCKHVVVGADGKQRENLFVGLDTEKGYQRWQAKVVYQDPNNDIAILTIYHTSEQKAKIHHITVPLDMFNDENSIVEGRGVLIIGYPLGLGIEDDKNHPIVRIGMIAQNTGKSTFLIDGIASHGNSGSPIFTLKAGNNRLVGMITSHVTDTITLYDELGRIVSILPYNAGLARAIRASLIIKAIEEASKRL